MNSYEGDRKIEKITGDFLDNHLYNIVNNRSKLLFSTNDRNDNNITEQLQGKDIILSSYEIAIKDAITDEKGQSHKYYPTFAFELSYVMYENKEEIKKLKRTKKINDWIVEQEKHRHYVHEGWLTDDNKISEFYMLIWYLKVNNIDCTKTKDPIPWKRTDDGIIDEKSNRINEVECFLIKRDDILKILKKNGYNRQQLRDKAKEIRMTRQKGQHDRTNEFGMKNGIWFYFTENLSETPINVVIPKETLLNEARAVVTVTENSVENVWINPNKVKRRH